MTTDVVFDYFTYVDVGIPGTAFRISSASDTSQVARIGPSTVQREGEFFGENGNRILWLATTSIPVGETNLKTVFEIASEDGGPLGRIRFFQYLDEDVIGFRDDVFFTRGTPLGGNLELFTFDNVEQFGVSQSGAFGLSTGLDNARFAGWAATTFDRIRPALVGGGQPVSPEGVVENLPALSHPDLGTVLGPRDIVSVLAWDIDPDASRATVVTSLGGQPESSGAFEPAPITPPGEREIQVDLGVQINPAVPTVVLTHGLQPEEFDPSQTPTDLWNGFGDGMNRNILGAGRLLRTRHGEELNVLQFVWQEAFQGNGYNGPAYLAAREKVVDAGEKLSKILLQVLGRDYSSRIHFVGHSLGTAVNAYAARRLLNTLPRVRRAQFTVLDHPNKIRRIPRLPDQDEDLYNYDAEFFAVALPIFRSDLELRIDNYFASDEVQTFSAVGAPIDGPVYNHPGLRNPNDLDDRIFGDELNADNDHSGVQQWYRWTIAPDGVPASMITPCDGAGGFSVNGLDQTLSPCSRGWFWSVNNVDEDVVGWDERFPEENGDALVLSSSDQLDLVNYRDFGCRRQAGGSGSSVINCTEQSSPFGVAEVSIPAEAAYLEFDFRFPSEGDGDYVALLVDNVPLWVLSADAGGQEFSSSGPIPLGGLTGDRLLTIALYGLNESNAVFEITNIRTLSFEHLPRAVLEMEPEVLNLRSSGRWITAHLELPGDLDVADVDVTTLSVSAVNGEAIEPISAELHPVALGDEDGDGEIDLTVKFDRRAIQSMSSPQPVVTGRCELRYRLLSRAA